MESKIFHQSELKSIEEREKGNRRDKNGTFSSRAKPKIKEMVDVWFPKQKELKKLIKPIKSGRKKKC